MTNRRPSSGNREEAAAIRMLVDAVWTGEGQGQEADLNSTTCKVRSLLPHYSLHGFTINKGVNRFVSLYA